MSTNTTVIPTGEQMPAAAEPAATTVHPLTVLHEMARSGATIEQLREMRALVEWYESREAEKAFNEAMTRFRKETVPIVKNRRVKFRNRDNTVTEYDHATLDHIVEVAAPILGKHGFSYRWERIPSDDPRRIEIECILTHAQGHSVRTSMWGYPDESGRKNPVQQVASTVTYLERYTLLMLTGLAAKGHDTDGAAPPGEQPKTITKAQATILQRLIDETGTSLASFLDFAEIEELTDLPASRFAECKDMLERRRANLDAKRRGAK